MDTWEEVLTTVVMSLISFGFGWLAKKKLADGTFLRKEIYSPLYQEVSTMHANISDFKKCHYQRSGHPDYSAPSPANRVPGNIRKSLIRNGQYLMLPKGLKKSIDEYYLKCIDEWDELVDIWDIIRDFQTGKLAEVQVEDEGRSLVKKYSNGRTEVLSSLDGKKVYQKYHSIEKLSEPEVKANLTSLQLSLQNDGVSLLKQLEQGIRNPNPLRSFLSRRG